jgi:hypothetical protein
MSIQPILPQHPLIHILRARDPAPTLRAAAQTVKRLRHIPLGARVEKRQLVALVQSPLAADAHLPALHVEHQARRATVVYEHEVAVQLDVQVARRLHGAVCHGRGCGRRDACEDGSGGQRDEGDGAAGEGARVAFDTEEAGEVGLYPGGDGGASGLGEESGRCG